MPKLTVKDLLDLKGIRQIAFVKVAREEEALAGAATGMAGRPVTQTSQDRI